MCNELPYTVFLNRRTGSKVWAYGAAIIGGALLGLFVAGNLGAALGAAVGTFAALKA